MHHHTQLPRTWSKIMRPLCQSFGTLSLSFPFFHLAPKIQLYFPDWPQTPSFRRFFYLGSQDYSIYSSVHIYIYCRIHSSQMSYKLLNLLQHLRSLLMQKLSLQQASALGAYIGFLCDCLYLVGREFMWIFCCNRYPLVQASSGQNLFLYLA